LERVEGVGTYIHGSDERPAPVTEVSNIAGQGSSLETSDSGSGSRTLGSPVAAAWRQSDEFDYQPLRIDARVSRSAAATMLAIRAEFSGWELARVLRFPDGSRRVWLRRRRSPGLLPDLTP
jgi:hypothetical protein